MEKPFSIFSGKEVQKEENKEIEMEGRVKVRMKYVQWTTKHSPSITVVLVKCSSSKRSQVGARGVRTERGGGRGREAIIVDSCISSMFVNH